MKNIFFLFAISISLALSSQTDFRFDNLAYKTLYPQDLCRFLKEHPNTVLLDVRSPGEFSDTSSHKYLNIGHLKNAINIPIDSVPKHMATIKAFGDRPLVIHCSHSQRSRRVSKMLADSGFKNMLNLNGGMTFLNNADEQQFACKREMLVHLLPYKTIPVTEAYELIKTTKDLVILDVRKTAEFEGKDSIDGLNIGRIKRAINLPLDKIKNNPGELEKYRNNTILVYDNYGEESNAAAYLIAKTGHTKLYNLIGGMSALIGKEKETRHLRNELLENTPRYQLLNIKETSDLLSKNTNLVIIDVRSEEEYNNKAPQVWRNLGRIKGAKHYPDSEFEKRMDELENFKKSNVLLYGPRAAKNARKLTEAGFENVNVIYEGMWGLVSATVNIDGFQHLRSFLENNQGLY